MQGMMDFSTQISNNITHLADGIRVDAFDKTANEMEARLLLERQLAEEKPKTLRLEYEANFRRHELAQS